MAWHASSRTGFSVRDLLIAVAAIGLLLVLAMYWVGNGPESAGRQNACRYNMRSVATAIISYESIQNVYPGFVHLNESGFERPLIFELMPHLERMDIYRAYGPLPQDGLPAEADTLFLEFLQCPSNPLPRNSGGTNIVFNTGMPDLPAHFPRDLPANGVFQNLRPGPAGEKAVRTSTADLTQGDGAVNTLLLSESLYAGNWTSRVEHEIGMVWHPRYAGVTARSQGDPYITARPSSNHPGVCNVGFADSHVRILNNNIDYRLYVQLLTTNSDEAKFVDTLTLVPEEFRQPLKEGDY